MRNNDNTRYFVDNDLSELLWTATGGCIRSCRYEEWALNDYVIITNNIGSTKRIAVTGKTLYGIVRDVVNAVSEMHWAVDEL